MFIDNNFNFYLLISASILFNMSLTTYFLNKKYKYDHIIIGTISGIPIISIIIIETVIFNISKDIEQNIIIICYSYIITILYMVIIMQFITKKYILTLKNFNGVT